MLYLVLFFLTKSKDINETSIKTYIPLKYFELFKFEKIPMSENKYARKLVFDRCANINTREINRC